MSRPATWIATVLTCVLVWLTVSSQTILSTPYFGGPARIGEASLPGPPAVFQLNSLDMAEDDWPDESEEWWPDSPLLAPPTAHFCPLPDDSDADTPPATPAATPVGFCSAPSFMGARPGHFFGTGPQGLGYYPDTTKGWTLQSALQQAAAAIPHMVLQLNVLCPPHQTSRSKDTHMTSAPAASPEWLPQHHVHGNAVRTAVKAIEANQDERGKSGKAKPTPRSAGPLSCSSASPTGPAATAAWKLLQRKLVQRADPRRLDAAIPLDDITHRSLGLWAIDTANANVMSTLMTYVRGTSADAFLGQETKVLTGDPVRSAEDALSSCQWRASIQPCGLGPAGGPSAGVAIGVRQHIGLGQPDSGPMFRANPRLLLRKMGAVCRGGLHLGSVYLRDVVGPTDAANLAILDELAGCLNVLQGPWVVGGDFNMTPEELAGTGFLSLVDGIIHAPADFTCGLKTYDYFIVSRHLSPAVAAVHAVAGSEFGPHTPVRLLLRAAPRTMRLRTMAKPRGFAAHLPFGPVDHQSSLLARSASSIANASSTADLNVHEEFPKLVTLVEKQLSAICSHDDDTAAAHAGRNSGPRLTWKPALMMNGIIQRAPPVLKAWALTAKWLRALACLHPSSKGAHRLRTAICQHAHQGDLNALDFLLFRQWQSQLSPAMLAVSGVPDSLVAVATTMYDRLNGLAIHKKHAAWLSWLTEGPGRGLSRQHKMSRTALGWIPSEAGPGDWQDQDDEQPDHELDPDMADAVAVADQPGPPPGMPNILVTSSAMPACPASMQQTVDSAAQGWALEWSAGEPLPECDWPQDLGPLPPMLELDAFKRAMSTFPAHLGLGWDGIHPRALLRLDDVVLLALLRILFLCECSGQWPCFTSMVIIALLPKPAGGLRPIGLFPWLPKVWAKARRNLALEWENRVTRPYLYAGPGRGADHAAWKQAAHAEHASCIRSAAYGMTLIDLVKAFDRVPWHVVVREARRLGYSLWILRLSIAAYRADRVLRVCGVFSQPITPQRSLTAGSAFATTEMRLVLINIVDAAMQAAPIVRPTLYVDDLSVEASGGQRVVVNQVTVFTLFFCRGVEADHMTVSRAKSLCTASTPTIGERLAEGLREFGIRYRGRVTSLGSAIGAGRRRNAQVLNKRLKAFKARAPRFRKLAAAGVCTKRLMRTGGGAALSYGQAVTGVSPHTLTAQRRAAAAACAPAGGQCGQDLDLALILADAGPAGRADPAHEAHLQPIGAWADAVWHLWLPLGVLHRIVETKLTVLVAVKSLWHHVRGPGAAMIASAWRLQWTVESSTRLVTDQGRQLDLLLDPPVVVRTEVTAAVRRWRDRNVFLKFPHLGPVERSHGLCLKPLWAALRRTDPQWSRAHQASLRAAFADRQWPQERCWNAKWTQHDRCVLCVDSATQSRLTRHGTSCGSAETPPEEPTHDDVSQAPVGSLIHRVCHCPHFNPQRTTRGPRHLAEAQGDASDLPADLQAAYSSGLYPVPRLVLEPQQTPPKMGTFTWVRWSEDPDDLSRSFTGRVYTDGSRIHDGHPDTQRLGWSFVALNGDGHVIAAARGTPPWYITDIPGAEAWAILQAAAYARPGSQFFSDCKPCVDAIHSGRAWACSAKRPLARVFGLLYDCFDHMGHDPAQFVWVPSHTAAKAVGVVMRGDNHPLTGNDRHGNALADNQARIAAGEFAVEQDTIDLLKEFTDQALTALKWLGLVTWLATHNGDRLARDSHASRQQANAAKRGRAAAAAANQPGHTAGAAAQRKSTARSKPNATQRAARWCLRAVRGGADVEASRPTLGRHRSHRLMRTHNTFWCIRCGAYAELRGAGLAAPCPGPVPPTAAGGRAQQLRFLKRGIHPKTRRRLAESIPWPPGAAHEQLPAGTGHVIGDELALSRSRLGQLQLRVRRRLAQRNTPHSAAATPRCDEDGPANGRPLPQPNATQTPQMATAGFAAYDPRRVRRTPHPALCRSRLRPLPPRPPPPAPSAPPATITGKRRRLRGKQIVAHAGPTHVDAGPTTSPATVAAADAPPQRPAKRLRLVPPPPLAPVTRPAQAMPTRKRPAAPPSRDAPDAVTSKRLRLRATATPPECSPVPSVPSGQALRKRPAAALQRPAAAVKRRHVSTGTTGPGPP